MEEWQVTAWEPRMFTVCLSFSVYPRQCFLPLGKLKGALLPPVYAYSFHWQAQNGNNIQNTRPAETSNTGHLETKGATGHSNNGSILGHTQRPRTEQARQGHLPVGLARRSHTCLPPSSNKVGNGVLPSPHHWQVLPLVGMAPGDTQAFCLKEGIASPTSLSTIIIMEHTHNYHEVSCQFVYSHTPKFSFLQSFSNNAASLFLQTIFPPPHHH